MIKAPPLPRHRLYSSAATYCSLFGDLISGNMHAGDDIAQLEDYLCKSLGAAHAICVPQARIGIYLAIKATLAGTSRRKVIMSPYTIFDVVNMVLSAGGIPVFADIERETCNIDVNAVERLIDSETAAVLVTHLHGLSCEMGPLKDLCQKHGAALVEDAAQAMGARYGGRPVGTLGDAGIFSFGMMKNVNSLYGGVLITTRDDIASRVRAEVATYVSASRLHLAKRALYGLLLDVATYPPVFGAFTYWIFRYSYLHGIGPINMLSRSEQNPVVRRELPDRSRTKFTPAQARLVKRQIGLIDTFAQARIRTAQVYFDALSGIPDVLLPPNRSDGSHTYMSFPIQVPMREELLRFLLQAGRDVAGQHLRNCADLAEFAEYRTDCPNARATADATVLLPTYPRYGLSEAIRTAEGVRGYFDHRSRTSTEAFGV